MQTRQECQSTDATMTPSVPPCPTKKKHCEALHYHFTSSNIIRNQFQ